MFCGAARGGHGVYAGSVSITDVWPLFGLQLSTPRLVLRVVRDEDFPGLISAALAGIHDADRMPFTFPWTDAAPDELPLAFARYHWSVRSGASENEWTLPFVVMLDGEPIGVQEMHARQFSDRRTIDTGSWLTRRAQGRGLGTEMRAGLLQLAFDHFGAVWAESSAMEWNSASLAVSHKLGYVPNGVTRTLVRPNDVTTEQRVQLNVSDFVRPEWRIEVDGVRRALELLGIPSGD